MLEYVEGKSLLDQQVGREDRLRTRRTGARYGTRVSAGGQPAALIRARSNQDYLTAGEFVEDVYGKGVLARFRAKAAGKLTEWAAEWEAEAREAEGKDRKDAADEAELLKGLAEMLAGNGQ